MVRIVEVALSVVLIFLFSLIFCPKILAVTITINSFPPSIDSLDDFQITASISGATNATNYLRVDLYKDGTSNYFGETFNGNDWYSGGDGKSYLPVLIQNSSASATIFAQFGNPSATQYPGPGPYKLKIRRYTSSGSASSNDNQTPVDIQINYVVPTPTPEPTPVPEQISTPFPTPPPPTKPPTPVPTPTKTPTPTPTTTPSPEVLGEASESGITENIPDIRNSLNPVDPSGASDSGNSADKLPVLAIAFVGAGIILIGVSGLMAYKKQKENPLV